ncbi:hypothetical protein [Streptomyces sp. NBC_01235]|uniref:hypothetical protein n=1 Tax=Streptomyces sp. NBC_01235 TaxID=2903788 RepID=UPI002E13018D|nr:hypothetical protein OG289_18935 [Streptomyces sp. NBC_01235]
MILPPAHERAELVEVVRIGDPVGHLTSRGLSGDVVEVWAGEEVREALALVAGLPDSPKYRCFLPGWGIRAYEERDPDPLFEIAFCFRCNGARIWGHDIPEQLRNQDFDAESPAGRELLRRFRACVAS